MAKPRTTGMHIEHEPECGLRVWRAKQLRAMARPHTHPDVEVNLLLAGGPLRYALPGGSTSIRAGRVAVFWGGVPHRLLASPGTSSGIWATVPLPWILRWQLPEDLAGRLLRGELVQTTAGALEVALFGRWAEDFGAANPQRLRAQLLELQALLLRIATTTAVDTDSAAAGSRTGNGSHIPKLTAYMAANYQQSVNTRKIAGAAGLHPRYAMRVFRKHFRMGLWEYLLRLRVNHAKVLLTTTDKKVLDVALESGFSSPAPFYNAFKKFTGCTPRSLRQSGHPA